MSRDECIWILNLDQMLFGTFVKKYRKNDTYYCQFNTHTLSNSIIYKVSSLL